MLGLKTRIMGGIFAASMVFTSVAGADTIAEFKSRPEPDQHKMVAALILDEVESIKRDNLSKGHCLERQFFTVDLDNDGAFDGHLFVAKQIAKTNANPKYRKT